MRLDAAQQDLQRFLQRFAAGDFFHRFPLEIGQRFGFFNLMDFLIIAGGVIAQDEEK